MAVLPLITLVAQTMGEMVVKPFRSGISEPLHEELQIVCALANWTKQQAIVILASNKAVHDVRRTFMPWL